MKQFKLVNENYKTVGTYATQQAAFAAMYRFNGRKGCLRVERI